MKDLSKTILAKAYAVEFLKVLDKAIKQICVGCQFNSLSQLDHYVCLGSISEKIFHASELLPGLIDERQVSYSFKSFLIELGIPLTSVPKEIFDVETRMSYFETDPDFMDVIASYATAWVGLPPHFNSTPSQKPGYNSPAHSPVNIEKADCEDGGQSPITRFTQNGGNH